MSWFIKLILAVAAIVFTVSMLCALALVLLVTSLWSLLHGRKPQVAIIWTRYRDMTRQMTSAGLWSAGRGATNRHGEDDNVVDVQVKEVRETPQSLANRDEL